MSEAPLDQDKIRKGFTQQPNCIWEKKDLTSSDKLLWLYLNTHTNDFNPPIKKICLDCGLSNRTVIATLKRLESYYMIKVIRSKTGNSRITNKYFPVNNTQWNIAPSVNEHLEEKDQVQNSTSVECKIAPRSSVNEHLGQVQNSTSKNTKENTNKNTKENNNPLPISKPSKFKFEQWQFDLAKKWIEYHQEHFPGTNPKPEQWANQIRIICSKRKHLNQESFTGLLNSIKNDSFWCDKATSLPSLNKPSKSNPDVLKLDQVLKGVRPSNKKPDYSIDDMFTEELKAMRENAPSVVPFDINKLEF